MYSERGKPVEITSYIFDEETSKERKRILKFQSKPVPEDFPERLKPYWKGHLEYSFTPCQSGWLYLAEKNKGK